MDHHDHNAFRLDPRQPLFQDPPDDLTEWDYHGCLIGGMAAVAEHELARSYKLAGDALVEEALASRDLSYELVYPVFFNYRHALELYLKWLVKPKGKSHKLPSLVNSLDALVARKFGEHLPQWMKDRLGEFAEIDPNSTSFRYSELLGENDLALRGEWWVEFHHLRKLVSVLVETFERIHSWPPRARQDDGGSGAA
jgi:hypothetical protein